jgi:hypothetical protein
MKSGYLYVLVHPSDPDLYKIGVTILHPEKRLAQHNSQYEKYAGKTVKETGQKWQLKKYIAVPDPYHAEKAFWGATWVADIPFRGGVEIFKMDWATVQAGLDAAENAGVRLPPAPRTKPMHDREWMIDQLEGTGITIVDRYRGFARHIEFQCAKGHVFKEIPGVLRLFKSCPCCVDWNSGGSRQGMRASLR